MGPRQKVAYHLALPCELTKDVDEALRAVKYQHLDAIL
jgi:hypothetical protein